MSEPLILDRVRDGPPPLLRRAIRRRRRARPIPELASRHHLENIDLVIDLALRRAGVRLGDVDAVAVTCGPGLVGSLLVGLQTAKAIAWVRGIPLLAVNHLEGHLRSVWLEHGDIPTPALSLIASGGHTSLVLSPDEDTIVPLARTRDDAAGEAFDKVAKLVGLGYPGGPAIDRLAPTGDRCRRLAPPRMATAASTSPSAAQDRRPRACPGARLGDFPASRASRPATCWRRSSRASSNSWCSAP
jgi:glycoprotease/Kae1 family metallohydrolase